MLSFALGQILIVIAVHEFICYRAQFNFTMCRPVKSSIFDFEILLV